MRNHSYENYFDLHGNETACRTHFHMKGFALRLVLKQRHKRTRKWPIPLHLSDKFSKRSLSEVLTFKMLVYFCRDKLKVASEELQKKKAYIDSLEPKVSSSGE